MIPRLRAWWVEREVMCDVDVIGFSEGAITVSNENTTYEHLGLNEVELMQSTSLKDKNGVEIYEGDVLYHPIQGARKVYYPYSDSVASYGLREINTGFGSTLQDAHAVWEVIGNIHENPELLEVAE